MKSKQNSNENKRVWIHIMKFNIVALILGAGIYFTYFYQKVDQTLEQITVTSKENPLSINTYQVNGNNVDETGDILHPMSFLLIGVDNRAELGSMNTDAIMIASFNPDAKQATLMSLPRDLKIMSEQLGTRKVNYLYPYFYNQDKTTALEKTKGFISELIDVPIDYALLINFQGLRDVVDELGGLELLVDMDMRYTDSVDGTNINLVAGNHLLNGKEVLDFVRYRKSNKGTAESSDLERNQRQKQVINKLLEQIGTLNGLTQLNNLLTIVGDNIKTDFEKEKLRSLLLNFNKIKPDNINSIELESTWNSPYIYLGKKSLLQAINQIRTQAGLNELSVSKNLSRRIGIIETN
ncbi:hypothetical protein BK120_30115 [Paenibacillus sp. FSL A5-0031]|uniref:LCP family protein n=1 Tax=Paenibacillus sp. FSL A5-0031 TaxID=1920420 RepID=UPI00096FE706|nr:LCP family protein [Paenibacillus sp. FSL A5-0031]OME75922.1 hypothetical protein BK120_30115 [Paenibacillus sp. FSL A5-0031]